MVSGSDLLAFTTAILSLRRVERNGRRGSEIASSFLTRAGSPSALIHWLDDGAVAGSSDHRRANRHVFHLPNGKTATLNSVQSLSRREPFSAGAPCCVRLGYRRLSWLSPHPNDVDDATAYRAGKIAPFGTPCKVAVANSSRLCPTWPVNSPHRLQ